MKEYCGSLPRRGGRCPAGRRLGLAHGQVIAEAFLLGNLYHHALWPVGDLPLQRPVLHLADIACTYEQLFGEVHLRWALNDLSERRFGASAAGGCRSAPTSARCCGLLRDLGRPAAHGCPGGSAAAAAADAGGKAASTARIARAPSSVPQGLVSASGYGAVSQGEQARSAGHR